MSIQEGVGLITQCTLVQKNIAKETTLWTGHMKANMSPAVIRFKRLICLTCVSQDQLLNENELHTHQCACLLNYKRVRFWRCVKLSFLKQAG